MVDQGASEMPDDYSGEAHQLQYRWTPNDFALVEWSEASRVFLKSVTDGLVHLCRAPQGGLVRSSVVLTYMQAPPARGTGAGIEAGGTRAEYGVVVVRAIDDGTERSAELAGRDQLTSRVFVLPSRARASRFALVMCAGGHRGNLEMFSRSGSNLRTLTNDDVDRLLDAQPRSADFPLDETDRVMLAEILVHLLVDPFARLSIPLALLSRAGRTCDAPSRVEDLRSAQVPILVALRAVMDELSSHALEPFFWEGAFATFDDLRAKPADLPQIVFEDRLSASPYERQHRRLTGQRPEGDPVVWSAAVRLVDHYVLGGETALAAALRDVGVAPWRQLVEALASRQDAASSRRESLAAEPRAVPGSERAESGSGRMPSAFDAAFRKPTTAVASTVQQEVASLVRRMAAAEKRAQFLEEQVIYLLEHLDLHLRRSEAEAVRPPDVPMPCPSSDGHRRLSFDLRGWMPAHVWGTVDRPGAGDLRTAPPLWFLMLMWAAVVGLLVLLAFYAS